MSKPFDATLKTLVENHPEDWLNQAGLRYTGTVQVIDADLSTVTTQADKLIRANAPEPCLLHVELQADQDEYLDTRVLKYNVLAFEHHKLPVHSLVVLLRPAAQASNLTGLLRCPSPLGGDTLVFRYQVIRVWEEPPETFLNGGLGLLPLAVVSNIARLNLPDVIQQMADRLTHEAGSEEAKILWTSAYVLAGLRYSPQTVQGLFQGVLNMRESSTYQEILKEGRAEGLAQGRAEELKRILFLQGEKRFGKPTARIRQKIETVQNIDQLEQLSLRLLDAASWKELLAS